MAQWLTGVLGRMSGCRLECSHCLKSWAIPLLPLFLTTYTEYTVQPTVKCMPSLHTSVNCVPHLHTEVHQVDHAAWCAPTPYLCALYMDPASTPQTP